MLYSQLCFQYCSEKQLLYISRQFQENTIVFEGEHEQKVEKIMVIPHGVGSKHHTSIITFLLFSKIFYPNITRQVLDANACYIIINFSTYISTEILFLN